MGTKFKLNSPAEEAAIQRGIAADQDNPEWGPEDFAAARPAAEVLPMLRRGRGPGLKPAKAQVTLRLDQDVIAGLRASGSGWQSRANEALRRLVRRPT